MEKIKIAYIATAISILPFYGYFLAYSYEVGYLSAFGITPSVAQIGLSNVIIAIISVSTFLGLISLLSIPAIPYLERFKKSLFIYPLVLFSLLFAATTIFLMLLNLANLYLLPFMAVVMLLAVLWADFVIPFIKHRSIRRYKKNVIDDRQSSNSKNKILSSFISKNPYVNVVIISASILFFTWISTSAIAASAASLGSNTYYVFKYQGKNYALIRNYSNNLLSIRYSEKTIIPGEILISDFNDKALTKTYLTLPRNKPDYPMQLNKTILDLYRFLKFDLTRFTNAVSNAFMNFVKFRLNLTKKDSNS